MKTLHLTLKRQWFDMILSGEKKEEYRDIKDYWIRRFIYQARGFDEDDFALEDFDIDLKNPISFKSYTDLFDYYKVQLAKYDTITFKNGYAPDAPEMVVECKGIEIKEGNPEWGAEPGTKYFVISLGKILSTKNIKK